MSVIDDGIRLAILAPRSKDVEAREVLLNSARAANAFEEADQPILDSAFVLALPPAWMVIEPHSAGANEVEAYQRMLLTSADGVIVLHDEGEYDRDVTPFIEFARYAGIPPERISYQPEGPTPQEDDDE